MRKIRPLALANGFKPGSLCRPGPDRQCRKTGSHGFSLSWFFGARNGSISLSSSTRTASISAVTALLLAISRFTHQKRFRPPVFLPYANSGDHSCSFSPFPVSSKFCRHNTVKFIVLREVIHKRQDHITEEDQPLAGACVADMRRLLVGDIQALAEDFPVSWRPGSEGTQNRCFQRYSRSPGRKAGP